MARPLVLDGPGSFKPYTPEECRKRGWTEEEIKRVFGEQAKEEVVISDFTEGKNAVHSQ